MALLSIEEINKMDYEEFIKIFGNVIEHCFVFAAAIWARRPFDNLRGIHTTFCTFIDSLPDIGQEGILRSHPDLAGRIAQLGLLTSESTKEQLAAGLNTLTSEEKATLTQLNQRCAIHWLNTKTSDIFGQLMREIDGRVCRPTLFKLKRFLEYKEKFGFPFVICARENKKNAILNGIAMRVTNSPNTELQIGIEEVKKIAFYRLLDIVQHTETEAKNL